MTNENRPQDRSFEETLLEVAAVLQELAPALEEVGSTTPGWPVHDLLNNLMWRVGKALEVDTTPEQREVLERALASVEQLYNRLGVLPYFEDEYAADEYQA